MLLTEILEAKLTCGLNFQCITLVCGEEIIMGHGIEFPKKRAFQKCQSTPNKWGVPM